jgi:ribosomal protein L40E
MPDSERQLGVIKDILLPLDITTQYDVYFTDKRIAIVCMGHNKHVDYGPTASRSFLFGIGPEVPINANEERKNKQLMEEKINSLPLDVKLKLSKKSCFYTHEEIEEVKLISGKKPKFVILSEDCVSKFSPTQEQFKQLTDLLPTIEVLRSKTSILGNLELKDLQSASTTFSCKYCGSKNDADAIFCESCGMKIKEETDNPAELTCSSCGARNKVQASFCKKCGTHMLA